MKNSGATDNDVKVSYVSIDDKEFPIESQLDFQIALYSFRQRARNDEIITLKLDRIVDSKRMGGSKRYTEATEKIRQTTPSVENSSEHTVNESPPEWFKKYMQSVSFNFNK